MDLDKVKLVAIIGDIGSGKTNLAVHLLRKYREGGGKKQICILGYPRQIDDFKKLTTTQSIEKEKNSIIFIDELTKFFPIKHKTNTEFMNIVRVLGHSGNVIIFSSQLSQDLTRQMEAFVDGFCITRIRDLRTLKNGSKIKNIVTDFYDPRRTNKMLNLKPGEYLEDADYYDLSGEQCDVKTFDFQNIGKDWSVPCASDGSSVFAPMFAHSLAHSRALGSPNNSTEMTLQELENELDMKKIKSNKIKPNNSKPNNSKPNNST